MSRNSPDQERLLREAAFRAYFTAHFPRVASYVDRLIGDHAAAEDVASEVFQAVWKKFDPDDPPSLALLFRMAKNKARDAQRKQYRAQAVTETLTKEFEEAPDSLPDDERLALHEAMQRLSEKDREIVRLVYWDGLEANEVAEVLRMRVGTVWTRLSRIRVRLREALDESDAAGGER